MNTSGVKDVKYELRVWKDATKMPKIEPKEKDTSIIGTINSIINAGGISSNPDIIIDNEDSITEVDVTYFTLSFVIPMAPPLPTNIRPNPHLFLSPPPLLDILPDIK